MIPSRSQIRILLRATAALGLICLALYVATVAIVVEQFAGQAVLPADCGLVFGAAVHGAGEPGPGIERRTQTAVRLYKEGNIRTMFLTGGKGSDSQESEATVMRKVALRDGVDPDDVFLEEQATSTIENLTFAKPMMQECSTVVGVSDRYHLARIRYIAFRLHWKNFATYPADRNANVHFEVQNVLREAAAVLFTVITFHPAASI